MRWLREFIFPVVMIVNGVDLECPSWMLLVAWILQFVIFVEDGWLARVHLF